MREIYCDVDTLDEAVNILIAEREQGRDVFLIFNGHRLFSRNITMESAWLQVVGKTREEHLKEQEELLNRVNFIVEKEKKESVENIPKWIQQGSLIIYPEKLEAWKDLVNKIANGWFNGFDLMYALEVMKALDSGVDIDEVKTFLLKKNLDGKLYLSVLHIVLNFSKKGPEYFTWAYPQNLAFSDQLVNQILRIARENAFYEKNNGKQR